MRDILEIRILRSGQPRAYADSVYEAEVTLFKAECLLDGAGNVTKGHYANLNQEFVRQICRLLVRDFVDKPGAFDAALEACEPIGPTPEMRANPDLCRPKREESWEPGKESRWRVRVREPYCD